MPTRFQKALCWVLLFSLLFSTTGVGMNTLMCSCEQRVHWSLFEVKHACSKHQARTPIKRGSCCAKPTEPIASTKQTMERKPCCQKGFEWLSLKKETTRTAAWTPKNIPPQAEPIRGFLLPLFHSSIAALAALLKVRIDAQQPLLAWQYGRGLRQLIQNWRC